MFLGAGVRSSSAAIENPSWWNNVTADVQQKQTSADQYFEIYDKFVTPGYDLTSPTWGLSLKKSIKAYASLLDKFNEKRDRPVRVQAQFQIGLAYEKLDDLPHAKEAFQQCLAYESSDPPEDKGGMELAITVHEARQRLEALRG